MTAVLLIALNFMREQRWFILLMIGYLAAITGVVVLSGMDGRDGDTLFILKQETFYGLFFSLILGTSVFHNDRKTRRIIAVLSKAIERRDYIAGIVLGVNLTVLVFYLFVFASFLVLFPQAAAGSVLLMFLSMCVASLLVSLVTVFYSTFLHPFVATAAAGFTLALPFLLERVWGPWAGWVLPAFSITRHALGFDAARAFEPPWSLLGIALVESLLLWLAASWVFARRDIAAAVE